MKQPIDLSTRYRYLFFDLDGTVTDPMQGITRSVDYALNHFGIVINDLRELCPFIGPPLKDSFMEFYQFTEKQAEEAVEKYRERYTETGLYENEAYPEIADFLEKARRQGYKLMMATSKPDVLAKRILEYFHLDNYFLFVGGSGMDGSRYTKADVIEYVLNENGITDLSEVVMIGDRKHDIIGAKKVGIDSIGVLYGYGDREELTAAGADYIVEDIGGLGRLLLK
ncbi:HAD family hydrolase [Bacteroides sp.]